MIHFLNLTILPATRLRLGNFTGIKGQTNPGAISTPPLPIEPLIPPGNPQPPLHFHNLFINISLLSFILRSFLLLRLSLWEWGILLLNCWILIIAGIFIWFDFYICQSFVVQIEIVNEIDGLELQSFDIPFRFTNFLQFLSFRHLEFFAFLQPSYFTHRFHRRNVLSFKTTLNIVLVFLV